MALHCREKKDIKNLVRSKMSVRSHEMMSEGNGFHWHEDVQKRNRKRKLQHSGVKAPTERMSSKDQKTACSMKTLLRSED